MPESSTISGFISKTQTRAFGIVNLTILAKLVSTEAQISILQTGVTETCELTLANTPLRCHLILGELSWKITARLSVLKASDISWQQKVKKGKTRSKIICVLDMLHYKFLTLKNTINRSCLLLGEGP